MRSPVITSILIFLTITSFSQDSDITTLTKLNKDWIDSYPTKDTQTLSTILANDFVLVNHQGKKMSKKDILAGLNNQEIRSAKIDSVEVKLLSSRVAAVTAYTTFIMMADGKEMTGRNCYQDIYMKRKGRWQAVLANVTLLSFK